MFKGEILKLSLSPQLFGQDVTFIIKGLLNYTNKIVAFFSHINILDVNVYTANGI